MNSSKITGLVQPVRRSDRPDLDWDVLRLDILHPIVSGNKLFKLAPWIQLAREQQKTGLISFGGPWSNHIVAMAFAAREAGLGAVGMIRGSAREGNTLMLEEARSFGMEIRYMDRGAFRAAREQRFRGIADPEPDLLLVPEGGYGLPGAKGAAEILSTTDTSSYSHICCACGTGTMLAGLALGAIQSQRCVGLDMVGQGPALDDAIRALLEGADRQNWETLGGHDLGGYARHSKKLTDFMNRFHQEQGIPSDIVYTGKLFMALWSLIESGHFPSGSRILAIHSGGLQGNRSLIPGTLSF